MVAAALAWGKQQAIAIEAGRTAAANAKVPMVRLAVDAYMTLRKDRAKKNDSEDLLKRYVLPHPLASAGPIDRTSYRGLARSAPEETGALFEKSNAERLSSSPQCGGDEIPASDPRDIPLEIKVGTKVEAATASPHRQLLTDNQVHALVQGAFAVDPSGGFGRLVLLAGGTGTRFCQLAGLRSKMCRCGRFGSWSRARERENRSRASVRRFLLPLT
jgi:hypothetical protein